MSGKFGYLAPLAELIEKEESYINALEQIVNGYMTIYFDKTSDIPLPSELQDINSYLIFANIVDIYKWHKFYFLKAVKRHRYSIKNLSTILLKNESEFHMYAKYHSNKPISDYLVNNHMDYFEQIQIKLKHTLTIKDLLIVPVRKPAQYKLMIQRIADYLKDAYLMKEYDYLNEALDMIGRICEEVYAFSISYDITNFDGLISDQGKLFYHDYLQCSYKGKTRKLYVFVFKRLIVFTEKEKSKGKYSESYKYRFKMPMNKIRLVLRPDSTFLLKTLDPKVPSLCVICKPLTSDLYEKWVKTINEQLMLQQKLINKIMYPVENVEQREVLL